MAGAIACSSTVILCIATISLAIYVSVTGERRHISREEYLEAKRMLKFLNRPSVKTIQCDNGDIYDCVDIYKHHSLDHPLLKNHTIQMQPSFEPINPTTNPIKNGAYLDTPVDIGLEGGGCPFGTIPVPRIRLEDILRYSPISNFGKKYRR